MTTTSYINDAMQSSSDNVHGIFTALICVTIVPKVISLASQNYIKNVHSTHIYIV